MNLARRRPAVSGKSLVNRSLAIFRLSPILVAFLTVGCSTLPAHYVRVLPAPMTSFPPVKPALIRLPVDIVFPSGGDFLQHISNLFKDGLQQLMPDLRQAPGLDVKSHMTNLWARIEAPIFLDRASGLSSIPKL